MSDETRPETKPSTYMTIFDTCYTMLHDWRQSGQMKLWVDGIMIKNINLLTRDQYNQYKGVIEPLKLEWTWLDNDDSMPKKAIAIGDDNKIHTINDIFSVGAIRPTLTIYVQDEGMVKWGTKLKNEKQVQTIDLFGFSWTRLNSYTLLCDTWIAHKTFNETYDDLYVFLEDGGYIRDPGQKYLYPWLIERYLLSFIKKTDVSLLNMEQYLDAVKEDSLPNYANDRWWFLRSKGISDGYIVSATSRSLNSSGNRADNYADIRPAIQLQTPCVSIPVRGKVKLFGYTFTAISDHLLLCDENVVPNNEQMRFHKNYHELTGDSDECYEKSDIRHWLEDEWFEKNLRKMREADAQKMEAVNRDSSTQQKSSEKEEFSSVSDITDATILQEKKQAIRKKDSNAERVEIAEGIYYYKKLYVIAREDPEDKDHSFSVSEGQRRQFINALVEANGSPLSLTALQIAMGPGYKDYSPQQLSRMVSAIRQEMCKKELESVLEYYPIKGGIMRAKAYSTLRLDGKKCGYYFPMGKKTEDTNS